MALVRVRTYEITSVVRMSSERLCTFSQAMGILRAACIFVSFGGVLLITWVDNGQTLSTMHGDYIVVITAFLYSLYVTLLKYLVPPNKVYLMPLQDLREVS